MHDYYDDYDDDSRVAAAMRPRVGRRFRRQTRYVHNRSEGLTRRRNGGSALQSGRRDKNS